MQVWPPQFWPRTAPVQQIRPGLVTEDQALPKLGDVTATSPLNIQLTAKLSMCHTGWQRCREDTDTTSQKGCPEQGLPSTTLTRRTYVNADISSSLASGSRSSLVKTHTQHSLGSQAQTFTYTSRCTAPLSIQHSLPDPGVPPWPFSLLSTPTGSQTLWSGYTAWVTYSLTRSAWISLLLRPKAPDTCWLV